MRFVVSSDWHVDRSTSGFSRFDDVKAAALQTVDYAIRERVDLWAFLGDLANHDDGPSALRAAELAINIADTLTHHQIRNVWVCGNHDAIESGEGRSTLSPIDALVGEWVRVYNEPGGWISDDGVDVVALPYSPASKPYDLAEFARARVALNRGRVRTGVVLAHATHVDGARQGEETLEMPRGRSVRLPVEEFPAGWTVLCGHFHTPQVTPSGVIVPGALARLTHGEETNEPRFLILDI